MQNYFDFEVYWVNTTGCYARRASGLSPVIVAILSWSRSLVGISDATTWRDDCARRDGVSPASLRTKIEISVDLGSDRVLRQVPLVVPTELIALNIRPFTLKKQTYFMKMYLDVHFFFLCNPRCRNTILRVRTDYKTQSLFLANFPLA